LFSRRRTNMTMMMTTTKHTPLTRTVGKLNETVPRRAVSRRALLSGSFSVSVGIEERRRACPFTDGQRDAERRREGGNERERERVNDANGASETRRAARSITNTAHGISESDSAAHATARRGGQVGIRRGRGVEVPPERSPARARERARVRERGSE